MKWTVRFHDEFEPEFDALPVEVQDELLACATVLAQIGPTLGRPHVDTLAGSKHANMKKIRFDAGDGAWRVPLIRSFQSTPPHGGRQTIR